MNLKTLVLTLSVIFISNILFAQWRQGQNQFFEGGNSLTDLEVRVDSISSRVWQIGKPGKTLFSSAQTKPNAILTDTNNPYPVNDSSFFTINFSPKSMIPFTGVLAVQWVQKMDLEKGKDGGILEYSIDTGNTWVNAFNNPGVHNFYGFLQSTKDTLPNGQYAFSGTDTTWRNVWLCFKYNLSARVADSMIVRFKLQSDGNHTAQEGWMIDNIQVHKTMVHTVNEIEKNQSFKVSPTITTGQLNLKSNVDETPPVIEKIELLNIEGKLVEEFEASPQMSTIHIGSHPNGIYFLRIKTNEKTETTQIMLQSN